VAGIAAAYAGWKTLEFGLTTEAVQYRYIGFDDDEKKNDDEVKNGIASGANEAKGPISALIAGLHLTSSMRGPGYGFGRTLTRPEPRRTTTAFLKSILSTLLICHLIFTVTAIILTAPQAQYTPAISLTKRIVIGASVGLAAYSGLSIGFCVFTIIYFIIHSLLRVLPKSIAPAPFDTRQYPGLILPPWHSHSITSFWGQFYH
jgi:hypothetical protein